MKNPDLSIIVLSWNTKELLQECLESVVKSSRLGSSEIKIELIIVDNDSSDGSKEFLKEIESHSEFISESQTSNDIPNPAILKQVQDDKLKLKVIFNDENVGFAKGNNQAIKQAQGEFVLLLNSDTEIKPGSLTILIDYLKNNPQTKAVSPQLITPKGKRQDNYYMKFPNFYQMIFYHNGLLRPLIMNSPLKSLIIQRPKNKPFEVDQLPGAALLTTRKTFDEVGLLNERFKFLFEDVDWCYRAKQNNYKLTVVPSARIMHVGGASWKQKLSKQRFDFYKQYFKSLFKFVDKHYQHKKTLFKLGLALSFSSNFLIHLITFKTTKAKVQLKLLFNLITF